MSCDLVDNLSVGLYNTISDAHCQTGGFASALVKSTLIGQHFAIRAAPCRSVLLRQHAERIAASLPAAPA